MRISSQQQYQRLQDNIAAAQGRMVEFQTQLSSGRRLQRPSDDPFAMLGALSFRAARAQTELHKGNAAAGKANMQFADTALQEMDALMKRANVLVVNGANGASSQEGRNAMAAEMKQLEEQLLSLANTQNANGDFIFAGFKSDTKPFVVNGTPPPAITYQGDNGQQLVDIAPGTAAPTNILIDNTVSKTYEALEDARTRLAGGDLSGLSGVSLQLIQDSSQELRLQRGDVGVNIQRFTDAADVAVRRSDDFTKLISDREDADIADVAVKLQAAQTTYQSALAAFQATHSTSLLEYLNG